MSNYADKLKQFGAGLKSGLDNWYSAYQERMKAEAAKDPMKMTRPEWQDPGSSADMQSVYDQIMNRKDFQFDLNGNALYQQLRNSYEKQGQLGTMNAIGNAAAMTGGYGNSYAAAAGQQAYQQSLEELNNKIPDLYSMALQQYQVQGEQLAQKYAVAADDRAFQYGVYRDTVGDWENDRSFYYQKQRDDVADSQWAAEFGENKRQFDENLSYKQQQAAAENERWNKQFSYQQFLDERNYNYQVSQDEQAQANWQAQFDYGKEQDALAQQNWLMQFDYNRQQDEIAQQNWQSQFDYGKQQDAVAQQNWQMQFDYNKQQDEQTQKNWNKQFKYNKQQDAIAQQNWEKNFKFSQEADARDWNAQQQQQAFNNNLALAQFEYGKYADAQDLAYKYAALGLRYG